ncbi:hypothetical protein ACKWTF_002925 [Chironomus riparius]
MKSIVAAWFLLCFDCLGIFAHPEYYKIGAIFREDQRDSIYDLAFKFAVHKINKDPRILPKSLLTYDIQYVDKDDSFHANKQVCSQIKNGSIAIISSDKSLSNYIQSTTRALDIPHILTHLEVEEKLETSINVHPSQKVLNSAFFDIMKFLNWTKCAIIYDQNNGLIQLRDLLSLSLDIDILIKAVDSASYHAILQELKDKEIYNMIVDIHKTDNMADFLKASLHHQMNDFKYHYLFTSLDLETFEMEDFRYNFVNITAFRLIDTSDIFLKETLKEMQQFGRQQNIRVKKNLAFETKVSLIYDAVFVFAIGLQTLQHSSKIALSNVNVSCKDEKALHLGSSLINFINTVEFKGISGQIEFKEGQRNTFKLDVMKLKQNFFVKCGEWSQSTGLNITDYEVLFEGNQMNTTLVVVTILQVPYVMLHDSKNVTGNARFYGFCVDLLEKISKQIGFNYILDLVHDRKYGAKDANGEWNGMVGVLMKHKADLAVASMTINYARESVIDFSKPFMNLGISILFKIPETQETKLFSFLNPLAMNIWFLVFFAYCLVSLTVCFWFVIGTLMQQGSDLNPKATSTRIVGCSWWFFSLIIISSYTANLAAFLTVERMITPIENAEDLAGQTEISYGTLESGSTMTFFRDSMIETYKKMWRFMENKKPSVFVHTYEEGIRRVLEGNYAFLMESTMLDYERQRDCNLTQIGGLLDTKGYGIALPKGSIWRDKISLAILELQEKGEIQMLYDKWWKKTEETCIRDEKQKETTKANSLALNNIGGVFVVLLCGLAFAVLVAIIEFCYKSRKENFNDPLNLLHSKSSLCAELREELCFSLNCRNANHQRQAFKRHNVCHECQASKNLYLQTKSQQTNMINDVI